MSLGIFVFLKNPKNTLHKSLLKLNSAVALWSLFLFFHYISKTQQQALITLKVLHSAAVFIPACYLEFIVNLLGIDKKRPIRIVYSFSIMFLLLSFLPSFILKVEPKLIFDYYATAGPFYFTWIIAYASVTSYGMYLMLKHYSRFSANKKNQTKYVFAASLIGFAGGATVYPLFYDIEILPVGEHIIFLYPIVFTIAVLKHNLMDINIVIKRAIVYSVSVIIITIVYLITVLLLERSLQHVVGYRSLWATVTAAIAIALLFNPLKNRIQRLTDRIYISGEYNRLKKELLESDKSKALANLAAGLAHEIRNPLTAIKTFSEYLPKKYNDKIFRENFSRIVSSEVSKINSLITQLLEFAKPSALCKKTVNIEKLLDYTLELLSGEMLKTGIKLDKRYEAKDPNIDADPNKMKHLFLNIIKNSIEAMCRGGVLTVKTYRKDNRFNIEITDTGEGIDNKDLNRIFEPFYSTKQKGAGLGLAIAQSIIAEHCGRISAKSTPGHGTVFTLSL
jgi:signal transduction histidine kinase